MLNKRGSWCLACFLTIVPTGSVTAKGQTWNFLGDTRIDGTRDHDRIQITRQRGFFSAIQLRISGDAIFFDRLIVHFGNGTTENLIVRDRISPGGRNFIIDIPGERRALESVELWYYKERWDHVPRVILYGS